MLDSTRAQLSALVTSRIKKQEPQIKHSLQQIAAGNPLGAETNESRRMARLTIKTGAERRQAEAMSASISQAARSVDRIGRRRSPLRPERLRLVSGEAARVLRRVSQPEAIWDTADFVGVEFLTRGRRAANAVGQITFRSGRFQGTGFLVAPGILLTNNHVIESSAAAGGMCVRFDYELDDSGIDRAPTIFAFDAARCFAASPIDALDFSLLALGDRIVGNKRADDFGYVPLSDAQDKHMLGELANIIQHPAGRPKQVVLRESNLVARDETTQVLHYLADTEQGSSGSPVFNNQWEAIALHHWAGPHLETTGADGRLLRVEVNEGIRISAIVRALRRGNAAFEGRTAGTVLEVLQLWDTSKREGPVTDGMVRERSENLPTTGSRTNADGSVSWVVPVEISVRLPVLASQAAVPVVKPAVGAAVAAGDIAHVSVAESLIDRGGYEPGFIHGFNVPLPDCSGVAYRLAKNLHATGTDRHELRYEHFSIVMNAERRLAAFTACNIDGARLKAIKRDTKEITRSPTLRALDAERSGHEGGDEFRTDERVDPEEQMSRSFYEDQDVPGFKKPAHPGRNASAAAKRKYARAMMERTARMLQKGHIILRGDPAWGPDDEALRGESDTFFYTNAAPQLGFFNQGSPDDRPGVKGQLRWRTIETYILRNARTERDRVCVFAGPVFSDDDPDYRFDSKLPLRFWKMAVWARDGELHSVAVIADQGEVLQRLTAGIPEALGPLNGAEAFDDPSELDRVSQFLTTVTEIERLTKLDFGDAVRNADVRAQQERAPLASFDEAARPMPRRPSARPSSRTGRGRK